MTDANASKKEVLDEMVNRGNLGDKKFHSETALQQYGEDEGVDASEAGSGNDPGASCIKALKRLVAYDIKAETSPAHETAFGTSLPHKLKHIPPQNNTYKQWRGVQIPEDLRSMSYVWEEIQHLTSTKAFQQWLAKHPHMPMPPFLKKMGAAREKKSLFIVPSDYILKDKGASTTSAPELALPVSQFSLELKEVLSRLMDT